MEPTGWYIKAICEKIRDDAEAAEKMTDNKNILDILQGIVVASYKIEADATGKDLYDLVNE